MLLLRWKRPFLSAWLLHITILTRNSAIADKPRDAFRGQSRSPNMVLFDTLGMDSYQYAIVTLSVRDIKLEKCGDLENRVRVREGH